jgi:hypothetical protein
MENIEIVPWPSSNFLRIYFENHMKTAVIRFPLNKIRGPHDSVLAVVGFSLNKETRTTWMCPGRHLVFVKYIFERTIRSSLNKIWESQKEQEQQNDHVDNNLRWTKTTTTHTTATISTISTTKTTLTQSNSKVRHWDSQRIRKKGHNYNTGKTQNKVHRISNAQGPMRTLHYQRREHSFNNYDNQSR